MTTAAEPKKCGACGALTSKDVVVIKGTQYHATCFTCVVCEGELGGKPYVQQEGSFYCEDDYYKKFSPNCGHCEANIKGQYIEAMGKAWHEDHFVCSECGKPFTGNQFHKHEDRPYCKEHYTKLIAETCGKCGKDITGEMFEAMDKKFHKACFVCAEGDHEIKEGESYHEYEKSIYCPAHLAKLLSLDCSVCGKLISGSYVQVLQDKMHQKCWTCATCSTILTAGNCQQESGKFFCKPCIGVGKATVALENAHIAAASASASSSSPLSPSAEAAAPAAAAATEQKSSSAPTSSQSEPLVPGVFPCYTYQSLKNKEGLPPDVDVKHRENYLADDIFQKLFGVDKAGFAKLPRWKKKQKKQHAGLW